MRVAWCAFITVLVGCTTAVPPTNEMTLGRLLGRAAVHSASDAEIDSLDDLLAAAGRPAMFTPDFGLLLEREIRSVIIDSDTTYEEGQRILRAGLEVFQREFVSFALERAPRHEGELVISSDLLRDFLRIIKPRCNEMPCPIPPCPKGCGKQ